MTSGAIELDTDDDDDELLVKKKSCSKTYESLQLQGNRDNIIRVSAKSSKSQQVVLLMFARFLSYIYIA